MHLFVILDELQCSFHGRRDHFVRLLVNYLSGGFAEWLLHDHVPRPGLLETHIANTIIHSVLRDLSVGTLRYLLQVILSSRRNSVKEYLPGEKIKFRCHFIFECDMHEQILVVLTADHISRNFMEVEVPVRLLLGPIGNMVCFKELFTRQLLGNSSCLDIGLG